MAVSGCMEFDDILILTGEVTKEKPVSTSIGVVN